LHRLMVRSFLWTGRKDYGTGSPRQRHGHARCPSRNNQGLPAIGSSPMASGIQFANQPRNRNAIYSLPKRVDIICEANGTEHRRTKPNNPCTNGQVKRMNRTIKVATVKRVRCQTHDQL
jgi:hypothetical protein